MIQLSNSKMKYENFDIKLRDSVIISIQSGRKNLVVPHYHTSYEFLKVTKGELIFNLDDNEFTLQEGDIVICPSFSIHSATAENEDTGTLGIVTEKLFYRDNDINSRIMVSLSCSELKGKQFIIPNSHPDNEKLTLIFEDIKTENYKQNPLCSLYISSLVNQASIIIARHFNLLNTTNSITNESSIMYALEYIKSHCTEKITLDELSRISKMSKFYFSHKFKEFTGSSPMDYVIKTRVNYALNLINTTNLSMTEISEKSGFCSVNYFNKTIREITGYPPYTYKKLK